MSFSLLLSAFLPIFALLALGFASRRFDLLSAEFWSEAEKLTYYVLFPGLLIHSLVSAQLDDLDLATLSITASIPLGVGAVALGLLKGRVSDGPAFTSLFQGGIRFNSYLGFALAGPLFGPSATPTAAAMAAIMIPSINFLLVLMFSLTLSASRSWGSQLAGVGRELAKNPLFVSCVVGLALNRLGIGLPFGFEEVARSIGRAALPMGVMAVGASLTSRGLQSFNPTVFLASSAVKFLLLPATAALASWYFDLEGTQRAVALLLFSLPTATSGYILAKEMGGDAPMMASLIVGQTLLALPLLPLVALLISIFVGSTNPTH